MKRILLIAITLLVALPVFCASPWESHFNARIAMLPLQVSVVGQGVTLLVGDSNTEPFWWSEVGQCRVINAGMGGANIRDLADRAQYIATTVRPGIVHIMIGANNLMMVRSDPQWATIPADLDRIVTAFQAVGSKVVMWPVAPFLASWGGADAVANRAAINSMIQNAAGARQAYWDWWWPEQLGAPYANAGAIVADGIHLSASSQISRYYRIEAWGQYLGGC